MEINIFAIYFQYFRVINFNGHLPLGNANTFRYGAMFCKVLLFSHTAEDRTVQWSHRQRSPNNWHRTPCVSEVPHFTKSQSNVHLVGSALWSMPVPSACRLPVFLKKGIVMLHPRVTSILDFTQRGWHISMRKPEASLTSRTQVGNSKQQNNSKFRGDA